jgi:membrane associated rhomboid family serine protease
MHPGGFGLALRLKQNVCPKDFPAGNYIVLVLAAFIFVLQFGYDPNELYLKNLILTSHITIISILGYMWLHTGVIHVLESIVLLFIFGRDVCLKIGSANYFLVYVIIGAAAAMVHWGFDGREAIGASGAIMGILGMYVVFCFKRLSMAGPWLILIWFLLSLTCGVAGLTDIANIDHCGGFLAGMLIASILMYLGIAQNNETDPLLVRAFAYMHKFPARKI